MAKKASWAPLGFITLILLALSAGVIALRGSDEAGLRAGIRLTARTSWVLFLVVFLTRPWNAVRSSAFSRWLLLHRRQLGVSLAVSQAVHLAFILGAARAQGPAFWKTVDTGTLAGGLLGYVFLLLMTVTSFDRTAAWIGKRAWRVLHTLGLYYLWIVFAVSYGPRSYFQPLYLLFALPLLIALVFRLTIALRARRKEPMLALRHTRKNARGGSSR